MPYNLPQRHRFAYDLCIFYHDVILGLLESAHESGLFHVDLDVTDAEATELDGLVGEPLYEWLEKHRDTELLVDMNYRASVQALLADFCPFVLEGLRAWAKGHLTLTYALLRKPFKDNLFYMEWLLADPVDFMSRFFGSSAELDYTQLQPERRAEIVRLAARAAMAELTKPELVYAIRFDRKRPNGLAGTWDQASHLITNFAAIRTKPQNFNFVFSNTPAIESQGIHLHGTVPYVMYHALCVVSALIATIGQAPADWVAIKGLRRDVGYCVWAWEATVPRRSDVPLLPPTIALPSCTECASSPRPHLRNLKSFAVRGSAWCHECRKRAFLDRTENGRA